MKKFRYPLEPLLKIRKYQEKQEFSIYGKMLAKINVHTQKIIETQQLKTDFTSLERKRMIEGYFNLEDKELAAKYYSNLGKVIDHAEKEISLRKEETEVLRKNAEKARHRRKILEILKEKKHNEYQLELNKLEFKELDEFNQRMRRSES
ncbi:MAG: flagellar export protein FliJ [Spirochaetia bacterium]|nr:flagellar export protein FliJ [Spirochaetia bacterium]